MKKALRLVAALTFAMLIAGCGFGKNLVPVANEQPQPDRLLFDRGKQLVSDGKNGEAITLFDTLINSYPDSPFAARAKLVLLL
ncbi:MAG TPA: hypothetical protein VI488_14905 [Candidatus Angelobacter sp.]